MQDVQDGGDRIEEMSSVFRILTIYEQILKCRSKGLARILRKKRRFLRNFVFIGYISELIRLMCVVGMIISLIFIRVGTIGHFTSKEGYPSFGFIKIVSYSTTLWLFVMPLLAISIMHTAYTFNAQRPFPIAFSFFVNFVFSIVLIALFGYLVSFLADKITYLIEILMFSFFQQGAYSLRMSDFAERNYCCGMNEPEDYHKIEFYSMVDPYDGKKYSIKNDMQWMFDQRVNREKPVGNQTSKVYGYFTLPYFCCKPEADECSLVDPGRMQIDSLKKMADNEDWGALKPYIPLPPSKDLNPGCLSLVNEMIKTHVRVILALGFIFTIFTVVTTIFVIVILLYHNGLGEIVDKSTVFDVTRCSLVYMAMKMDRDDAEEDFDLVDFSIIEMLKRSDIDRVIAEYEDKNQLIPNH